VIDRWARVKTVFAAVLDAESERQPQVLHDLCGEDTVLRDEVQELLEAHGRRGFVDELAERLAEREDTAPTNSSVPARIGRYEVTERIGQGGMAVVYKGHDPRLDRYVALKLLRPARVSESDSRRRLVIEARAAAALDHPSIATIYEVGDTETGCVFIAMAFYEGETLQERIDSGPLPVADAVRIAHQIACGLAAAHAGGITHRDLKPANVLLTRSGSVKLLDFGIAKMTGVEEPRAGDVLGTLAYMSPEQLRGEKVDARADVWALGLVLYEMLTGERLSAGRLQGIPAGDPARLPSSRRRDTPPALDRIVERALNPLVDERYRDGSELTAALARFEGDSAQAVRLPAPVTNFFGRERETEDITRRLAGTRLVTLTGPGGTGKTRLALQIAWNLRERYEDGASFVSLAALSDPGLVCSEIARGLGIAERPDVPAVDGLASFLRCRRLLLVLDNFEHVVLAAPAVARLLADCAGLQLLVTSRVPLKVAGEHEYPVPSLTHPQAHDATIADLEANPATALFLDRARAVRPDFAPAGDETRAIAELCARLDGLPLAIELAAARVKLLSPLAMLARLDRRFDLLSTGGPDRPARHQSLRQALAWSYDLLTTENQTLFRRIAVFVGGCALDDTVSLSKTLGSDGVDALEACTSLLDHSLLVREDGPGGLPRLRLLETIREFAFERLEASGEADRARRAHAGLFLALAEQSEPHMTGPDQAARFDQLELEHDNLRAALSWAQTNDEPDIALRLGSALWRFWAARAHLREGRERLEQVLAMPGGKRRTLLRARVLNGAATLIDETCDYSRALPLVEESVAIAREHNDRPLMAIVLNNLAWTLVLMGDSARAETLCEDALKLNRELADPRGIAVALNNLAWFFTWSRGDYDRACALHEESLEWRRVHGDLRGIAFTMTNLARADLKRGALDRAPRLLEEARTTLEDLHDRALLAWTLSAQGILEHASGRPAAAFDRFEASIELLRPLGNVFALAAALVDDAALALDQGARDRALRDLEEALPLMRRTGHCSGLSEGLRARAHLAQSDGDHQGARGFYREALALYTRLGNTQAIRLCQEAMAGLENQ
jgi:predicted ATPase/tRNA A-37 threonylcarbamoyl transferase component Bud32